MPSYCWHRVPLRMVCIEVVENHVNAISGERVTKRVAQFCKPKKNSMSTFKFTIKTLTVSNDFSVEITPQNATDSVLVRLLVGGQVIRGLTTNMADMMGDFIRNSHDLWPIGWSEGLAYYMVHCAYDFKSISVPDTDERSREWIYDKQSHIIYGARRAGSRLYLSTRLVDENNGSTIQCASLEISQTSLPYRQMESRSIARRDELHNSFINVFQFYHNSADFNQGIVRGFLRKYLAYTDSPCGSADDTISSTRVESEPLPTPTDTNQNQNTNLMTNETNGIVYATTGRHDRGIVNSYHRKPAPLNHAVGAKHVDIAGVSSRKLPKVLRVDNSGDYSSKFTIGFEIEKNELHRDALKEYPLFCGFETDGSCGYEAVTNILPLLPDSKWRDKVFALMDDAEKIIEDAYSPSDQRCGGHITIAVEGLSGVQLMSRIRKNCGIVYALWRHRLKNRFCNQNTNMYPTSREPRSSQRRRTINGFSRYSVATVKGNCLEFRLPHRVSSVKQLKLRYELFYEIVDFTINNPRTDHAKLLERLRPIIMKMYDNNLDRVDKVIGLASGFREFILTKTITEPVSHVLCPDGAFSSYLSYVDYATDLVNLYQGRHDSVIVNDNEWRTRFKRAFPNCSLPSMSV